MTRELDEGGNRCNIRRWGCWSNPRIDQSWLKMSSVHEAKADLRFRNPILRISISKSGSELCGRLENESLGFKLGCSSLADYLFVSPGGGVATSGKFSSIAAEVLSSQYRVLSRGGTDRGGTIYSLNLQKYYTARDPCMEHPHDCTLCLDAHGLSSREASCFFPVFGWLQFSCDILGGFEQLWIVL